MLTGVIFDVAGTLVESVPQNLRSLGEALKSFGYEIPKETLQLYSGLDGDQTLQLVVPDADEPERQAILKAQGKSTKIDPQNYGAAIGYGPGQVGNRIRAIPVSSAGAGMAVHCGRGGDGSARRYTSDLATIGEADCLELLQHFAVRRQRDVLFLPVVSSPHAGR